MKVRDALTVCVQTWNRHQRKKNVFVEHKKLWLFGFGIEKNKMLKRLWQIAAATRNWRKVTSVGKILFVARCFSRWKWNVVINARTNNTHEMTKTSVWRRVRLKRKHKTAMTHRVQSWRNCGQQNHTQQLNRATLSKVKTRKPQLTFCLHNVHSISLENEVEQGAVNTLKRGKMRQKMETVSEIGVTRWHCENMTEKTRRPQRNNKRKRSSQEFKN